MIPLGPFARLLLALYLHDHPHHTHYDRRSSKRWRVLRRMKRAARRG